MDVPFEPPDRTLEPGVVDELRVRRLSGRADPHDAERERLRTALADSATRIAELEDELSATRTRLSERVQEASSLAAHRALAEQLEAELAREREARRHAEDLLAGERDRFARVLAASQLELREELDRARADGRSALEAARAEGVALREQLAAAAAELDRAAAESRAGAAERAALEQELRAAQAALAERAGADDLRAELAARAAAEERAIAELTSLRAGTDIPPARSLAPDVPPADHPALGNVADRAAVPDSVIADLARAAERLRELAEAPRVAAAAEPGEEEPAARPPAEPADSEPLAPAAPHAAEPAGSAPLASAAPPPAESAETEPLGPAAPLASPASPTVESTVSEPLAPPRPLAASSTEPTSTPGPEPAAAAAQDPAVGVSADALVPLPPALPARPTAVPWLAPALAELAREDPTVAARVFLDLLPVQGLFARRALTYEVAPEHGGRHLVHVDRGAARVERDVAWGAPAAVRIAGPVGALAPLVAGGRAKPQGALVLGRKRRLRRLLRDARAPIGLPELARAGARPAPADLLALLAATVRPDRTRGTSAVVAYVVGGVPRAAVVVADGAPLVVLADPSDIDATAEVHTEPETLLEVLAGTAAAQVRGDRDAAERLHRRLRAAQGLDA